MQGFGSFFERATGVPPCGHEARLARDGLPGTLRAPTLRAPAGVILAWLWRRLHGPGPVRAATARRLIWALPQGSLLEPLSAEIRGWLARLELARHVSLHVVAGARGENVGDWRENAHRPAIVVGTIDMLASKALNRGYGISQAMWPIDFALTVNGAHWVIDEAPLCPQATTTLRQVARFAGEAGTTEPFCMTLLSAVPHREPAGAAGDLVIDDGTEDAVPRPVPLDVGRLAADPGDYGAIAASAAQRHARGTRTLVVLNTVDAARQVYRRLRDGPVDVALLHARLRGIERGERLAEIGGRPEDLIVVGTQVVEAGIGDLNAALLVTEAAPWPSLAARARHCGNAGAPGTLAWVPPAVPVPYGREDVAATAAELTRLEGTRLRYEELVARGAHDGRVALGGAGHPVVIGRNEFGDLFDTGTCSCDTATYLRDADDLELEVAWATWAPGADGAPAPQVRLPPAEHRCRVGVGDALRLADGRRAWQFDQAAGAWRPVTREPPPRLTPGELLLVNAADGGYDTETGFDPLAPGPVRESPVLLTPDEQPDLGAVAPRAWQSLNAHSEQVRDQVAALLKVIAPQGLGADAARSAVVAGWLHDLGKAHPTWQDALCALAEPDERHEVSAGRPWAKSGKAGRLEFAGNVSFRHELASLLLVDGPHGSLLDQAPDRDLARFLVVAHHGRLRARIGDPDTAGALPEGALPGEAHPEKEILGLRQGAQCAIPAALGHPASTLTVDLRQFAPGSDGPWTKTVAGLLTRYGPFALAYLEAIVRIADWRASGGRELPDVDALDIGAKTPQVGDTGYSLR